MAKLSNTEVRDLTDVALDAFWAAVAARMSQAKGGDLSPERTVTLRRAAENAIAEWVDINL